MGPGLLNPKPPLAPPPLEEEPPLKSVSIEVCCGCGGPEDDGGSWPPSPPIKIDKKKWRKTK